MQEQQNKTSISDIIVLVSHQLINSCLSAPIKTKIFKGS